MGLTPLEGLVMGTRCGDVDPGLFEFVANKGMEHQRLQHILNKESGLLGLSGTSNDMRSLVSVAESGDGNAQQAIDVFCFRLARYIGAMMASLQSLDALVFTGGIGENSALVRAKTVAQLTLLGFTIEKQDNVGHGESRSGRIESQSSRYPILVIATDEEAMIADAARQRIE